VGLRRTLRRGRKALARADKTRKATDFHELRKRVKDHWYHARLVAPFQSHAERVEHLSRVSDTQHDLVITVEHIDDEVLLPIHHKGGANALSAKPSTVASRFYDESPKQWSKRVRKYWRRVRTVYPLCHSEAGREGGRAKGLCALIYSSSSGRSFAPQLPSLVG